MLKKGDFIVEPTSGNTGIAFAMIASIKGYKFIAVLPKFASKERSRIIKYFGGQIHYVDVEGGDLSIIIEEARKLAKKLNAYLPNQFENEWNIRAHYKTGKEIYKQMHGDIDAFVAGVGTGGTLIGIAKYLKEKIDDVKIYAVEPENSAVLSGKSPGRHVIEGIGEGFIPKIVKENFDLIDGIITISDKEALNCARKLAKLGYFVGISSGANAAACLKVKEQRVVTVFPDSADRYFSTKLFEVVKNEGV